MPQNDGSTYTFEIIEHMLKGYKDMKRKALQLEFEITHYTTVATCDDMIEAMTFGKPEGDGVSFMKNGSVSDKTAKIAVSYIDELVMLNKRNKEELGRELRLVNTELLRIEYYIRLLGGNHTKVLSMLYLEELTYIETAEKIKLSITSIRKLRKAAISKLVDMYKALIC